MKEEICDTGTTALKMLNELTKMFNGMTKETYKELFALPEDSKDIMERIRVVDDNAAKFFSGMEQKGENYERLTWLIRGVMSLQPTSSSVDSAMSAAGRMDSLFRSRLKPVTLEKLVVCQHRLGQLDANGRKRLYESFTQRLSGSK